MLCYLTLVICPTHIIFLPYLNMISQSHFSERGRMLTLRALTIKQGPLFPSPLLLLLYHHSPPDVTDQVWLSGVSLCQTPGLLVCTMVSFLEDEAATTYPLGFLGEMSTGGPGWGISSGNISTHICRRPLWRKEDSSFLGESVVTTWTLTIHSFNRSLY